MKESPQHAESEWTGASPRERTGPEAAERYRRHFVLTAADMELPLYVESIGFNSEQEAIRREQGYPYYHWLETVRGEGRFSFEGKQFALQPGHGVLLLPYVPHRYEADPQAGAWQTRYVTFGGAHARELMLSLGLYGSMLHRLKPDSPVSHGLHAELKRIAKRVNYAQLDGSSWLYCFLIQLKKYSQMHNQASYSEQYEKLLPLLDWLEDHCGSPDLDLAQMARICYVSPQYLNTLFRSTFDASPYSYLIQLRVRKAKERLIMTQQSVADIGRSTGFRDASHFISSFRRHTGMTPKQFRRMSR